VRLQFWKNKLTLGLTTLVAGVGIGACVARQGAVGGGNTAGGVGGVGATPAADVFTRPASADPVAAYIADKEPIVQAVQKTAPAVVAIDTSARVGYTIFDSPLDRFEGRGRNVVEEVPTGAGSGVLLDGGFVMTNEHVVGEAARSGGAIKITLADGRTFNAKAVGTDKATDIALLKVEGSPKLPIAPLGEDDKLLPGQTVIAIGNPVGLSFSVSAGVVSALGRPVSMPDRMYENLIQTDTAINPGNSGGALIDLGGRVIGINTLVRSDAQNIGFAIPLKTALRVVDELKQFGRVRRPATGVVPLDLNPLLVRRLGLPQDVKGVIVRAVYRNSPAVAAGIRPADIITEIAGQKVTDEASYRKILNGLKIGQTVTLKLLRPTENGPKTGEVSLRLSEQI
jgi:S1-C subfamily serine protease